VIFKEPCFLEEPHPICLKELFFGPICLKEPHFHKECGPICSKQIVSCFFPKEIGETWSSPLVFKEVASPCLLREACLNKFLKDYRKWELKN
jgi:hypothetical protein